ncbi:MAG: hypothetical protein ACW981_01500 [Candidatus Hodarchaeales archaeon]|jgi:hypothetical protein
MLRTKKFFFLLQELDPFLEKYPSQNSIHDLSEIKLKKIIALPNTNLNMNSLLKKEKYYILLPEFLPLISNESVLGLVSLIRPEFSKNKLKSIVSDIKSIFQKNYTKFSSPILCFFLILQVPTISHFKVLQKLSLLEELIKNLNHEYPQILLFPKFIDSSNALWPVIIKDVKWLNQFQGNVNIQNKQFLTLLESSQYEDLRYSKIIDLPSTKQLITTRSLCFGCRKSIENEFDWGVCRECGAIICNNCLQVLQTQPMGKNLCPGNIFAGINFHIIDIDKQKLG